MTLPNHTDLYQGLGRLEGATVAMGTHLDKIEDVLERIDQRLAYLPAITNALIFNAAFTPSATGGNRGAGTINVATNVFKNNVAYTNP